MIRNLIIVVLIGLATSSGFTQKLKEMSPDIGWTPDLSAVAQRAFERRDILLSKSALSKEEQEELDALMQKYDETSKDIWDIIGGGCSWYCGEGPYKILSSSSLSRQGDNDYSGEKAHDLSFRTAWVEGVKDYGQGEYVEYYFRNKAPRITEIKIFNGYVKSEKVWTENSRVKKLKLSINGVDYAILNLLDTRSQQNFKIEPLGRRSDGEDLVLRFTIVDYYKGSKYDDTCITEIYFDGIDVH